MDAKKGDLILLEVDNLNFYYDKQRVLANVTFAVAHRDFFGVVGPNGSGKTTLLKCVSGILKPASGRIRVNGLAVQTLKKKEIARNIAVVPQSSAINFDFTAQEMVMLGRNPHISRFGMENQRDYTAVENSMKLTRTKHLATRLVRNLSGGELQRVIIARALAQEPKLLLLDEPTVHLDINNQLEILELIKRLNREKGLTVISVLHDLNLAAQYCNRLLLMDQGKVASIGAPPEVLTSANIKKTYHVNVLIRKHPATSTLYLTPFTSPEPRATDEKPRIHIICGGGSGSHLMKLLYDAGYNLTAGVLNVLDSDYAIALSLNMPVVDEAPFSAITNDAYKRNLKFIFNSDLVILADAVFGKGNLKNLDAANVALDNGIPVMLVEATSLKTRNYAGRAGEQRYSAVKQRAIVVQKPRDVLKKLEDSLV